MESINLKEKGIIDFKNKLDKVFNEMDYYIKSNNITPIYKGMFQNKANNIPNMLTMEGTFYFYLIFTNDKALVFGFNENLKKINFKSYDKNLYNDFCLKKGDPSIVILNFKGSKATESNQYFLYDNFLESDPDLTIFTEFLSSQNFNENYKLKENKPTGYRFWKITSVVYSILILVFVIAVIYGLLNTKH